MNFRPCIDIYKGKVVQIIGDTLGFNLKENFVSTQDIEFYANYFKTLNLKGGHIIILDNPTSIGYELSHDAVIRALQIYPNGFQVGGGIRLENAKKFIDAGANHIIISSLIFSDNTINFDNLNALISLVGREKITLDLSCKQVGKEYYIAPNKWKNTSNIKVDKKLLDLLCCYCDEFLVHAINVEGKRKGPDMDLIDILKGYKVVYAGGINRYSDIFMIDGVDICVGSGLDIYGGDLSCKIIIEILKRKSGF